MNAFELLAVLRAGSFPRIGKNPGPLRVTGHFTTVLETMLDRFGDAEVEARIVHRTEEFCTVFDGFPKSQVHLLVLPRITRVASLGQLRSEHLPMLRRMSAYVTWVSESLASQLALSITHGVHKVPSLRQLHVHVISQDFVSPCLKNAKHYNSFQPPFFVSLSEIVEALEAGDVPSTRLNLDTAEERMKALELRCNRCGGAYGRRFAELKKHLASCTAPAPAPAPLLCEADADGAIAPAAEVSALKRSAEDSVSEASGKRAHITLDLT